MKQQGLTLMELLVVIAVVALLLTVAVPSFQDQVENRRLSAAAQALESDLVLARSEAIKRRQEVSVRVNIGNGNNWCYGVSTDKKCDCTVANASAAQACILAIDGTPVLQRTLAEAFPTIVMSAATRDTFSFDGVRGLASGSNGSVSLSSADNDKILKITVSALGRVRACIEKGSISGYSPC